MITPNAKRALVLVGAAWAVLAGSAETLAQVAGAQLADPTLVAAQDPYALSPNPSYGYGSVVAPAGWIDRPIFDGHIMNGMMAGPRAIFGPQKPFRSRLFLRGDFLAWDTDPMETPTLVTTNPAGTPQNQAGYLGGFNTQSLFGGEINDGIQSGFRVRGGWYVDPSRYWAIGGDYYELIEFGDSFTATSDGTTILGRPFYDIVAGRENATLSAFPSFSRGTINIDSTTSLRSLGINVRADAINPPNHASQIANDCAREARMDLLIGFRNMMLDDTLNISEDLESLVPPGGTINLNESFATENNFNGVEFGYIREVPFGRWWFESEGRIAVGTNAQKVTIAGQTQLVENGVPGTFPGGLLAQRTNIGTYERNELAVVPELGLTLGFHVTPRISLQAGYTLVYFSNVVRAGDQIDTDLNPGLIPVEADPLSGPLRPRFVFRQNDFFAHGLTAGADFRF